MSEPRPASERPESDVRRYVWLLALMLLTGALYFGAAGSWGLWEPWETQYAGVGREQATAGETLIPLGDRDDPLGKPLIVTLLMDVGYRLSRGDLATRLPIAALALLLAWPIGGLLARRLGRGAGIAVGIGVGAAVAVGLAAIGAEELWLRAPYAALAVVTVVVAFDWARRWFGAHRAGIAAAILATSPIFMLSAVNLAGAMPQMAFTTWALVAFFTALHRQPAEPGATAWERAGRARWALLAGALTGLTLWAGGMPGLMLVLGTVAAYGGWSLARQPDGIGRPAPLVITGLVAAVLLAYPAYEWFSVGFEESKDVIGFFVPLGLAVAVLVAATWSAPFRALRGWGLAWFLGGALVVARGPLFLLGDAFTGEQVLHFLLYNEFLTRRTLADHVTFDTLIRQLGFAAYPYTMFLPLAFAWLVQTVPRWGADGRIAEPAPVESDDAGDATRSALKMFAACWLVVGLVLVGLTATLTRHYIFVAIAPAAAAVGLMLTDGRYWSALRANRTALYTLGVACLVILMVLTKDLKTVANPEMGQLGPEVLFEFLLIDGRVQFPKSYTLPYVPVFRILWVLAIAVFFWMILRWPEDLGPRLKNWAEQPRPERTPGLKGRIGWAFGSFARLIGRGLGAIISLPARARVVRQAVRSVEPPPRFAALFVASAVVFAGVTAAAYMPALSDHLSNRGLVDTYQRLAAEGETFYRVGTSSSQVSYYLGEDSITLDSGAVNPIESLRSVGELRRFFCQPESRMWAMIERDSLAQAYYEVRHHEAGEDCDPERDLWVLDARSSRFVLVSNMLGEGEENQNPLAQHVFAELPADVIESRGEGGAPWTFDGQLRVRGYRVLDEDNNVISEASSGDRIWLETFFEVVERAPSPREMFIHVDFRNQRINGDHQPVNGEFPINYWVPGEIVRDRYQLLVEPGSATGDYGIYIGFFSGDSRMQVRPPSGDNRVRLGNIQIHGGI